MEGSSFSYGKVFPGHTIMVIVPHEDDEINLAGSVIYGARKEGFRVICVFVTNGDWQYPGFIRMHEAIHSLETLGVLEKDVVFLGYPDSASEPERNIYKSGQHQAVVIHGQAQTYGMKGHEDFAFRLRGEHQAYTWEGLKQDMKDVILHYKPDTIFTNDFDFHPDHRMTSLAFDESMRDILSTHENYKPLVLKGFCYSTAIFAPADFYGKHALSTVIHKEGLWNKDFDTDNPAFIWANRIRFPADRECRNMLSENVLADALSCHVSQKTLKTARKVINTDQVFWWKKTNNLAFRGMITVSSGDGRYLHDFKTMEVEDISAEQHPRLGRYLWEPDREDRERWCRIDFDKPEHVEAVTFYGNIEKDSRILQGKLTFSTGYSCIIPGIEASGRETYIEVPPQDHVKWIRFDILKSEGLHAGLSEWEILPDKRPPFQLLHICVDDQIAYHWHVWPGEKPIVSAYTWGIEESLQWYVDGEKCSLEEVNKRAQNLTGKLVLRVEVKKNPRIYNEAILFPADAEYRHSFLKKQKQDRLKIWWKYQMQKWPHHKLKKMKREEEYKD